MPHARDKGARGEREAAAFLRAHGFDAERASRWQSRGSGDADVAGLPGFHVEVKRVERLNIWSALAQAERDAGEDTPVVLFRRNRSGWYCALQAEAWIRSLRMADALACPAASEDE